MQEGDSERVLDSKVTPERKILSRRSTKGMLVMFGFLMLIFPPWTNTFSRPGAAVAKTPAGYGFLFSPPAPRYEGPVFGVELDLKRLMLQIVLLGGAFGLLAYTNKRKEP